MDSAPFLTPWYLKENNPKLIKNGRELKWRELEGKESAGIIVLENKNGESHMLLDMSSYILVSKDNKSFLVWSRKHKENLNQCVDIFYYETENLTIFNDQNEPIKRIRKDKIPIQVSANKEIKISLNLEPKTKSLDFIFPNEFKKFGEFMILTEVNNLYEKLEEHKYWHNTILIDLKTAENKIAFYSQDWFNKSEADFNYQWITRAIRNPKTNLIIGQGIRIDDFELDNSCEQLMRNNVS